MTWLGQKPESEPTRSTQPAVAANPQVAPQSVPTAPIQRMEPPKVASIGKSLHVKGELRGSEDLAIEGRVEGKIALTGFSVTIGQAGKVSAEIHAKTVVIGGLVEGDITADERVEVAATGTVVGNIRSPRVVLNDGARFKGSIDMESKSAPRTSAAETLAYSGATRS